MPTYRPKNTYRGTIVDPFSDWSKAYYQHKVKEGKSFREKRRDKDKWAQRQIALYRQHTEVDGVISVNRFLANESLLMTLDDLE